MEPSPDIVARLKAGDRAAFDAVYDAFRPRIYGFLLRMSGQRELAEDLTQDVFLRLAVKAPRLADDSQVGAWLFTVARNALYSHRRRLHLDWDSLLEIALRMQGSRGERPDSRAEARSEAQAVEAALLRLPLADREVLLLVGVEQLSHAEASAIIGVGEPALRKRLSRARERLAALLDDSRAAAARPAHRRLSWTAIL